MVRTRWPILLAGLLLAIGGWKAWEFRKFWFVANAFDGVRTGDLKEDVVRLLGTPSYEGPCTTVFSGDDGKKPGCRTEFEYPHPFAPILPEYYVVRFGEDDRVRLAYRFVSP